MILNLKGRGYRERTRRIQVMSRAAQSSVLCLNERAQKMGRQPRGTFRAKHRMKEDGTNSDHDYTGNADDE